jgi:HEAT repeats
MPIQPSRVGLTIATVIGCGLILLGAAICYLCYQLGPTPTNQPIAGAIACAILSVLGVGLIVAARRGYASATARLAAQLSYPSSPWMWRPDWAAQRAVSLNKSKASGAWWFGLLWNLITVPALWKALPQLKGPTDPRSIFLALFGAVGFGVLVYAIRITLIELRFGNTYFQMDALPFAPGGRVSGSIALRLDSEPPQGIDLKLACIRRVVTGGGRSRSVNETPLWETEANVPSGALQLGPTGRAIPVNFAIPADALVTNQNDPNDQILWRLHAKAKLPGIAYSDDFEIPVFSPSNAGQTAPAAGQAPTIAGLPAQNAPQTAAVTAAIAVSLLMGAAVGAFAWRMAKNANISHASARSALVVRRNFSSPMTDADLERIAALPVQMQAEELFERAIEHDHRALVEFEERIGSWNGRLQMTPRMTQLERRSEFSNDLRVRNANADMNLAVQGWTKDSAGADALLAQARPGGKYRANAVYMLGMLGGRGVDYDRIHEALLDYARNDKDADVRKWTVEGLRYLGKDEALDELFYSFTHDPSYAVRDRAGCNISDCGNFTRAQRMRMVPQLIDLAADSGTTGQMRNWCFLALQEITDESLPANADAWANWYREHGADKLAQFESQPEWQVRGDE